MQVHLEIRVFVSLPIVRRSRNRHRPASLNPQSSILLAPKVVGEKGARRAWIAAQAAVHLFPRDFESSGQIGNILGGIQFHLHQEAVEAIAGRALLVWEVALQLFQSLLYLIS